MNNQEIEKRHHKINKLLSEHNIKDALDILLQMIILTQSGEIRSKFDNINGTYKNLLKYTVEGFDDPERNRIYNQTIASVYELADNTKQVLLTQNSSMSIYRMKREFERRLEYMKDSAVAAISDLNFEYELDDFLKDISMSTQEDAVGEKKREEMLTHIFKLIWLVDTFGEKDILLIRNIKEADQIPWYEKSVMVSALTLSLIRNFDLKKIELLFEFFDTGIEQVWQRALVGLLLSLYIYDERLYLYPTIRERLIVYSEKQGVAKDVELVIIQLLRSRETEKISKKLQEEIIPEVMKMSPKLEDKLDIESLLSQESTDDKNPEWEDFFKDTPDLYEKMEEFTNMQMEGSDVFWSAFAMLKHFDFFNTLHHWFLPFHKENKEVLDIFTNEKENIDPVVFLEGISKSAFLCNSDKYSFCFNIMYMPKAQKSLIMEFFSSEMNELNEMTSEDDLLNKSSKDKFIITQYIQDLYRFYKLHPLKHEFADIFNMKFKFHNTWFLNVMVNDQAIYKNIAEFYFEKDHFDGALDIYKKLIAEGEISYEVYEKMGYCLQQLQNYKVAVSYYLKAELFDTNRLWLLKKIGFCYRKLDDNLNAIKYYTQALKLDSEDQFLNLTIGHCFLSLQQYDEALNYFYKLEYLSSENVKVLRPIAWILFLQGKFENAFKYYSRILGEAPNRYDYMNMGHVEWCLSNKTGAIDNYMKSIQQAESQISEFLISFNEDKPYLVGHGVPEDEIPLVLDHLKYVIGT